jgi:hypothetical protein
MGNGNYSYEAHQAITAGRASLPTQQVFKQKKCHPLMNPHGVKFRESRDGAGHPNSLGIVFALDVSGSMGAIPEAIARKELPQFMKTLLDCGVTDPQVLFMAFSDVASNEAPLQVGQFESTAELMYQWLTWCWIEGGGRTPYESYELALYFAARHTALDCFEKRKKKGYLFMTGDEPAYDFVKRDEVKALLGEDLPADIPLAKVVEELQRMYEPYFLIPDPGRAANVATYWRGVLGKRVITMETPGDTCAVAAGLVALNEKLVPTVDALGKRLTERGMAKARVEAVMKALR